MKVLVNVPKLSNPGGVSVLYNVLKIQEKYTNVKLFQIHSKLPSVIGYSQKYIEFTRKINDFDIIHLNPSLNRKSFLRDAVYAMLAKKKGKKVVVYWHGWEDSFEKKLKKSDFLISIFKKSFQKADLSIVLGKVFLEKLQVLGCLNKIVIETNTAESKYIASPMLSRSIESKETITLLFIARLQKDKGVYEAIETLKILNKDGYKFKLIIAGSGAEDDEVKKLALKDRAIDFLGYIKSEEKHHALLNADILFFPTYYPEGLPLTILEGIMYGLPIVSRPVGGIPDIVENNQNGFITESKDPNVFAELISTVVKDKDRYVTISKNNIKKSIVFTPQLVCERFMSYYQELATNNK